MKKRIRIKIKNKAKITALIVCFLLIAVLSVIIFPLNKVNGSNMITYRDYTVKAGDTLWSIASNINEGNMDIREIVFDIKNINALDSSGMIITGEQIMLPVYGD